MELESYFDFSDPNIIRIKGTRIGIDIILEDYLNCASPEEIAARYRNLSLEQVYATLTYYFHNQAQIDKYLEEGRRMEEQAIEEYERNLPPGVKRLRELKSRPTTSVQGSLA